MSVGWVVFDVNGTLLDPAGIADLLGGGRDARRLVAEAFQAALLLTMADTLGGAVWRPLPDYLRATLEQALRAEKRELAALDEAMARAAALDPFPDAHAALADLRAAGFRTGVLTNSTTDAARSALHSAGLGDVVEAVLGSELVRTFKPDPRVYENAAAQLETSPSSICLVAAHAWDVVGAKRSGLRGAWVARGERWPAPLSPPPDVQGEGLAQVARAVIDWRTP
jgi:2-haloacid dehalogenase